MAQTFNPNIGGRGRWISELGASQGYTVSNPVSRKEKRNRKNERTKEREKERGKTYMHSSQANDVSLQTNVLSFQSSAIALRLNILKNLLEATQQR